MNAPTLAFEAPTPTAEICDCYVVTHGKSGILGSFTTVEDFAFERGDRVVVESRRGLEIGVVLCPASILQARLLGAVSSGTLLRPATDTDERLGQNTRDLEDALFDASRDLAQRTQLDIAILDVDLLLDREHALLQFLGSDSIDLEPFVRELEQSFPFQIRLENIAGPQSEPEPEHNDAGCGKPDCGKIDGAGGGCTSCGTGGCSSCGTGVDLRAYFGGLRQEMEQTQRVPLL